MSDSGHILDRRHFLKTTAAGLTAAAAASAMAASETQPSSSGPPVSPDKLVWRSRTPDMEYARLGRTNYMVSRVVAGWGGDEDIWRRMISRGLNYFDSARGYGNSEPEFKPFMKKNRDKLWVTSKATGVAGYNRIDPDVRKLYLAAMKDFLSAEEFEKLGGSNEKAELLRFHEAAVKKQKAGGEKPDLRPVGKKMAELYAKMLDESLERSGVGHFDAYFMHGVEIPWIFDCLEVWEAYEKANKAGKVKHFGFSCHKHHKEVLAAAVEADTRGPWKIDLCMPGVNPESFDSLRPQLEGLKKRDIGVIAMKTAGIKNRPTDGREKKFESLIGSGTYNEWERSKLWMLHLTDGLVQGVIAAMKNNEEMAKDLQLPTVKLTTAAARELRTVVKYEMAGSCSLCGHCESRCPEHIAVTDMIRYHAYVHQYNEKDMARELYKLAGYSPSAVCTHCGHCADACASDVPITSLLSQVSAELA